METSRGDAAAATCIFRGDESRRRRGRDVRIPWRLETSARRRYSCPCRFGLVFGCRRPPTAEDLAPGGRVATLAAEALDDFRDFLQRFAAGALDNSPTRWGAKWTRSRPDNYAAPFGPLGPFRRAKAVEGEGIVFEAVPGHATDDVFPLAAFEFEDLGDRDCWREPLSATLRRPVAVRGLIVALLEADDRMSEFHDSHPDPNMDMEHVGAEGYAYEPFPRLEVAKTPFYCYVASNPTGLTAGIHDDILADLLRGPGGIDPDAVTDGCPCPPAMMISRKLKSQWDALDAAAQAPFVAAAAVDARRFEQERAVHERYGGG